MTQHRFGKAALLLAAFLGLSGFTFDPVKPEYNPAHYVNNDPAWSLLAVAKVTTEAKAGVYTAAFPAELQRLENKSFTITGFMMPLEATPMTDHFILMRRNSACPFCPPNSPTEAIEIRSKTKFKYTGEEIMVTGVLKLVPSSADGLFFRLDSTDVSAES
jgi:hypothetical protein